MLSVVTGQPLKSLPEARYSGGVGLRYDAEPCGETTATHWASKDPPPTPETRKKKWTSWFGGK